MPDFNLEEYKSFFPGAEKANKGAEPESALEDSEVPEVEEAQTDSDPAVEAKEPEVTEPAPKDASEDELTQLRKQNAFLMQLVNTAKPVDEEPTEPDAFDPTPTEEEYQKAFVDGDRAALGAYMARIQGAVRQLTVRETESRVARAMKAMRTSAAFFSKNKDVAPGAPYILTRAAKLQTDDPSLSNEAALKQAAEEVRKQLPALTKQSTAKPGMAPAPGRRASVPAKQGQSIADEIAAMASLARGER